MRLRYKLLILICVELIFIVIFITKSQEDDITYKINYKLNKDMLSNTVNLQDELKFTKADKVAIKHKNKEKKLTFNRYTVSDGNSCAYMYLINGDGLSFKTQSTLTKNPNKGSIYLDYVLQNSYPNISLEEMGVSSEEEAYIATSYALSYVATLSGESFGKRENTDLYSMYEFVKRNNYSTAAFTVAERLVSYSRLLLHENVDLSPQLIRDVESSTMSINGGRITIGPYKITSKNAIFVSMDITLKDSFGNDISYTLLDRDGNVIRKVKEDEYFYIAYYYDPNNLKVTAYNTMKAYVINSYIYEMRSNDGNLLKFVVPTRNLQTVEFTKDYVVDIGVEKNEDEVKK